MTKHPTSFRLSADARRLLKALAERHGISEAAILEMLIRERARMEKVK